MSDSPIDLKPSSSSWAEMMENEEKEKKAAAAGGFADGIAKDLASLSVAADSASATTPEASSDATSPAETAEEEKPKNSWKEKFLAFGGSLSDYAADLDKAQKDPNNPLFSEVVSFESLKLRKELIEGLYSCGFKKPSNIQGKSLPIILNSKDNLIAQSQSGTGKTACFALAMLSAVDESKPVTQCICICNSLELADQIHAEVSKMAKYTKITLGTVMKGMKPGAVLNDQILVGTPGKVKDLIARNKINTKNIKMFVLDEADQMLEDDNLRSQSIFIKTKLPKTVRVLLFSATYTEEDKQLERQEDKEKELQILEFADKIVPEPRQLILVPREKLTLEYMRQYYVEVPTEQEKFTVLKNVYEELNVGQSIIFVNKVTTAEMIKTKLEAEGFPCAMLHGQLEVPERKRIMADFREAKTKVLLSTNVIARGLDVSSVTHVVNYDVPVTAPKDGSKPDVATYLHRIGRTARFGRKGVAINICASSQDRAVIDYFQKYFGINIQRADKDEIDETIK